MVYKVEFDGGFSEGLFDVWLERRIKSFIERKEYAKDKMFYNFIGLDSLLHAITIILLYNLFI
jgi:hypothetical protein